MLNLDPAFASHQSRLTGEQSGSDRCKSQLGFKRGLAAIVIAVALVVTACSSASPGEGASPASSVGSLAAGPGAGSSGSSPESPKPRWQSSGLGVHSDLSASKDSIVYAGVEDGEVKVVALDPQRGTERWRHASDVSKRVRGVELKIHTDDDTAYFLTRGSSGVSPVALRSDGASSAAEGGLSLTAVTTATGQQRWSTPLSGEANPDVQRCGTSVCVFVYEGKDQQLWSLDPATGKVRSRADVSLPGGPGGDAIITGIGGDDDISSFISASRGPVVVGQYSADGGRLDWSQPVDRLFSGVDVSPEGGWAGWPAGDGGWVIWLGSGGRRPTQINPGDTFTRGAVAGAGADGSPRWLRNDRHPCFFTLSAPVLCDGVTTMSSSTSGSSKPTVMEGVDPVAGTTSWTLPLGGAVDEFDTSATVLRLDDSSFLVTTADGPRTVDLRAGPKPANDTNLVGWCQPRADVTDTISVLGRESKFIRSGGHFPCHLGGQPVDEPASLPIPDFAGAHSGGYSAWVVNGVVHAELRP